MKKKSKQALYRTLRHLYGKPTDMSVEMRRQVAVLVGGWLAQSEVPASVVYIVKELPLVTRTLSSSVLRPSASDKVWEHAREALAAIPRPSWHWKIAPRIYPPKGMKDMRSMWSDRRAGRSHIGKGSGKTLELTFPINYHVRVPDGVRVVDRKIIQTVSNHRVYSDKETWECAYYDLSGLGKEENTWTKAVWREGYLVRMATGLAAEPTLSRAIKLATGRTIRSSVRSILRDASAPR